MGGSRGVALAGVVFPPLERDGFSSIRHLALASCLNMISAQTLRVCRGGKPVPTFPDHALASLEIRLAPFLYREPGLFGVFAFLDLVKRALGAATLFGRSLRQDALSHKTLQRLHHQRREIGHFARHP